MPFIIFPLLLSDFLFPTKTKLFALNVRDDDIPFVLREIAADIAAIVADFNSHILIRSALRVAHFPPNSWIVLDYLYLISPPTRCITILTYKWRI